MLFCGCLKNIIETCSLETESHPFLHPSSESVKRKQIEINIASLSLVATRLKDSNSYLIISKDYWSSPSHSWRVVISWHGIIPARTYNMKCVLPAGYLLKAKKLEGWTIHTQHPNPTHLSGTSYIFPWGRPMRVTRGQKCYYLMSLWVAEFMRFYPDNNKILW